ncbi:MAG: class I SAM-dependent methyltransferase [PVC group bacterium]
MGSVILKPKHEASLLRRHPWVFSGAVAAVAGGPAPGETVEIRSSAGRWLGRGAYSPHSQIRVRVWTFEESEAVGPAFFRDRLCRALDLCSLRRLADPDHACRLVHGESDGLPGLIVDRYGGFLVCQFLAAGPERWKEAIAEELGRLVPPEGIYERSDGRSREKEGLPRRSGTLRGKTPPDLVEIREGECRFLVDLKQGQKTGFYLDQRENRAALAEYAPGARVLNCFSYTGGFAVAALRAGAESAVNIDSAAEALDLAARNLALNGLDPGKAENVRGNAAAVMRLYRDSRRRFDLVVLDPPKFAESRGQVEKASRAYKDINLLALKLLKPGGALFTFSCSSHVGDDLFRKIVAWAALDAGREVRAVRRLGPPPDHPVALNFPEGAYLKGLVCVA